MLIGVGNDIVDIRRIEAVLERMGERFIERILRPGERAYCERRHDFAAAVARHYALKEAAVKALGTGFRYGVGWRDVGLTRPAPGQASFKPMLTFEGGARQRIHEAFVLDVCRRLARRRVERGSPRGRVAPPERVERRLF